jgi:ribosomal protein L37AE/L43A
MLLGRFVARFLRLPLFSISRRAGLHIVQRLSFKCLICGHDDVLRRTSARLYLQCEDCGRETCGWEIEDPSHPRAEHRLRNREQFASTPFATQTQTYRNATDSLVRAVQRAIDALSASRLLRFWRDNVS